MGITQTVNNILWIDLLVFHTAQPKLPFFFFFNVLFTSSAALGLSYGRKGL